MRALLFSAAFFAGTAVGAQPAPTAWNGPYPDRSPFSQTAWRVASTSSQSPALPGVRPAGGLPARRPALPSSTAAVLLPSTPLVAPLPPAVEPFPKGLPLRVPESEPRVVILPPTDDAMPKRQSIVRVGLDFAPATAIESLVWRPGPVESALISPVSVGPAKPDRWRPSKE